MADDTDLSAVFSDPESAAPGDRTFLGGTRLTGRLVILFMLGVLTIAVIGGGFLLIDIKLRESRALVDQARGLADLALGVDARVWQLRAQEKTYLATGDSQYAEDYDRTMAAATTVLNALFQRPDAAQVHGHVTTINEGLTDHAKELRIAIGTIGAIGTGTGNGLVQRIRKSAEDLEDAVAKVGSATLRDAMVTVRRQEGRFFLDGGADDLKRLTKDLDRLVSGSGAAGTAERDLLADLAQGYLSSLLAYADARTGRLRAERRLDEVFAYLAPSVDGLVVFAEDRVAIGTKADAQTQAFVRILAPAGAGAAVLVLTLLGIMLMGSVTVPVQHLADAADRVAEGETDVLLPALGNRDEVGDLARAVSLMQDRVEEALSVHEDAERARSTVDGFEKDAEAARAETVAVKQALDAARAEAAAVRHELETARADADSARAEVVAAKAVAHQAAEEADAAMSEAQRGGRSLESARIKTQELARELETVRAESRSLHQALDATKAALEEKSASLNAALARLRLGDDTPPDAEAEPIERSEPAAARPPAPRPLTSISQDLARSSETISAAVAEAEKTDALIRGLDTLATRVADLEGLFGTIGEQTNLLAFRAGLAGPRGIETPVMAGEDGETFDESLGRRFDTIRSTAGHAQRIVRDVARVVSETRVIAHDIAAATSTEALEASNDLLQQSEHLRAMLDELVVKIHGGARR